jgi:hypothetical protein
VVPNHPHVANAARVDEIELQNDQPRAIR